MVILFVKMGRELKEEAERLGINLKETVERTLEEEIRRVKVEKVKKLMVEALRSMDLEVKGR